MRVRLRLRLRLLVLAATLMFAATAETQAQLRYQPEPNADEINQLEYDLAMTITFGTPEERDEATARLMIGPGGPPPTTAPPALPPLTLGPITGTRPFPDQDYWLPGLIKIDPAVPPDTVLIEGELTDSPPMLLKPTYPSIWPFYGDFIYFPPNSLYPTGVIKVPGDQTVTIVMDDQGRHIPMYNVPQIIEGETVWVPTPVPTTGGGSGPVMITPGGYPHYQPANPFPKHPSLP